MSRSIIVVGYGTGISAAVAEKFGGAGFSVGLVARNVNRLAAGVAALQAKGIKAAAFPADAGDSAAIRAVVRDARAEFGAITIIHWNAVGNVDVGDILTTDPAAVVRIFEPAVGGLLSAVQEALPDLTSTAEGAVLVTNGISGETGDVMDEFAVQRNVVGLGLANAAKSKLVGLLAQRLKGEGVYVGQVMITGLIKGSRPGMAGGIEPSTVAEKFWEIYLARDEVRVQVS